MPRIPHAYAAMRWLLQLDQPVPERTEQDINSEVSQNYRWNFTVNLLDGATFWSGLSFISATTIVPLFVSKLSDSPLAIGLAAVIAQGGWFLPQLFTANSIEKLARKKPVIVNLGFFTERLPLWLIVLAAVLATRSPQLALFLFFLGYAWHGLGAGVVATAWQDLIARCFPVARRGRFFGTTMFVGAGAGALTATFSAWVLRTYPFPTNFVLCFLAAAILINASWVFLALTREPVEPVIVPRQSNRQFWADLPRLLRRDKNFRHFLVARLLLALASMGSGFVTVAAVRRWAIPDSTVGVYTAMFLVGQTAGNLFFGYIADRYGHKIVLEIGSIAVVLAFALAWLAPAPGWFFVVFFLLGIHTGTIIVSGILVVMEFCAPAKRPTYAGLANTGAGIASSLAPLVGAGLAQLGYDWLFAASSITGLVALALMRWWVREPRQQENPLMKNWTPPTHWHQITTIDAHTAGEPFRVITGGFPEVPGETMLARRRYARAHLDHLRTALMWEPRGHADMYGCLVTPPVSAGADFGVLFLHNEGYSTMCGHGIIAITKVVLETGLFPMTPPLTTLRIDSPAGLITAYARISQDRVVDVSFHNVPSFVVALDETVEVPGLGEVRYDLAFGGGFYAYVQAEDVGVTCTPADFQSLITKGMAIKRAVMAARPIPHPFAADLSFLYGTIFIAPPLGEGAHSRNVCIFAEGEVDRCPTGTGVSGRLAIHHARGEIGLQQPITIESIIGTRFSGQVISTTTFGPHPAIIPEVAGTAYITGRHQFLIDPDDPLQNGFILR